MLHHSLKVLIPTIKSIYLLCMSLPLNSSHEVTLTYSHRTLLAASLCTSGPPPVCPGANALTHVQHWLGLQVLRSREPSLRANSADGNALHFHFARQRTIQDPNQGVYRRVCMSASKGGMQYGLI